MSWFWNSVLNSSKFQRKGKGVLSFLLLLTPQPGGLACWDPRLPCSMSLKLCPWLCISLAKFPSSCLCPPMGRGAPLSWEIGWCRPRRQGVGWGDPCLCIQTDGRLPDKSSQAFLLIKSLKNVTALKSRIFKGWQRTASDPVVNLLFCSTPLAQTMGWWGSIQLAERLLPLCDANRCLHINRKLRKCAF